MTTLRLLLALCCLFGVSAHADPSEPPVPEPDIERDEFDVSWLDEDKVIYVVQPRKYPKVDKFEFSLSAGIKIDSPFRTTKLIMPRLYHYFTEKFGGSLVAAFKQNDENSQYLRLKNESSVLPTVRDIRSFYGATLFYMPWFGKMNFFNKLTYVDWHFELGLAQVNTKIDLNFSPTGTPNIDYSSHLAMIVGTGQRFTLSKQFTVRLDALALLFNAPTGAGGVITTKERVNKDYQLTAGIGYAF